MKRNRMLSSVFFLALLAGIILAVVLFVSAIASYPAQAEKLYGSPSSRLSAFQRFSLSYQLVRDRSVLLEPTDPNWPEVVFSITIDEATASILNRLEASGLVPDEIIHRKKVGFHVPVTRWFEEVLSPLADDVLLGPEMRDLEIWDPVEVRNLLDLQRSGKGNYGMRIWSLVNFALWYRHWFRGESL